MLKKIKVVIADDSAFFRQVLKTVLEESRKIVVVAAAKNGKEAVEFVKTLNPDILILDCDMPVMNGLDALKRVMDENPLPVLMFSALTQEGAKETLTALSLGAVDFLLKPAGHAHALDEVAEELIKKIETIVRQAKWRVSLPSVNRPKLSNGVETENVQVQDRRPAVELRRRTVDLIAMGSSTGGVQASTRVLMALPENTAPIVWVQHMPPEFTKNFAERLNGLCQMEVKEAKDGDLVKRGICYLAPGGFQMRLLKKGNDYCVSVKLGEKVSGQCPSCNVLFDSAAEYFGDNALGIILTGMGDDGASGLAKMHQKGAYVIGQNEKSCVVYGMPKAAYNLGAVDIELDIQEISDAIIKAGG
ncbi:MAG: chemotaxis response regulator protein-glutamate methylesterase [Candidatus Omnitrophica bacterium]|nr:chemotaxis response regulator protein-glutamate methylesterase [Candidatus Omnitrophota bacterium]